MDLNPELLSQVERVRHLESLRQQNKQLIRAAKVQTLADIKEVVKFLNTPAEGHAITTELSGVKIKAEAAGQSVGEMIIESIDKVYKPTLIMDQPTPVVINGKPVNPAKLVSDMKDTGIDNFINYVTGAVRLRDRLTWRVAEGYFEYEPKTNRLYKLDQPST